MCIIVIFLQQQYWPTGAGQPVPGGYNNASQSPYDSPAVQATVPGSSVSTASVASPTGAVVSSPDDMVRPPHTYLLHVYVCAVNNLSITCQDWK